jgi:acyl-CoA synthetase (AMP-forming)/AMP-acid ligase II
MDVGYLVERSARQAPQRELWRLPDRTVSYEEGFGRIRQFARFLESETAPGARVALLTNNRFEGLEAFLGTLLAGRAAVPIHVRLSAAEIEYILADSGSSVLVHAPELRTLCAEVASSANVPQRLEFAARQGGDKVSGNLYADASYENALRSGRGRDPARPDPDDTAWLFYTSGTTGKPKGAQETHRNLLTMVQQFLIDIIPEARPSDCYLHVAPISHSSTSCSLPYLAVGACNAFYEGWSFDPPSVLGDVERFSATATFLVPTMIHDLERAMPDSHDVSSLQTIIYGGGPAYAATMTRAREAFGNVFAQFYGQGEAPVTITGISKHAQRELMDSGREAALNSVGRECCAVQVEIRDDEGRPVPPDVPGEIWVRGDLVMKGYWNRPEATRETIRDGWLRTGDVGYRDDDGYVFLTDRSKDVIISGGSNIYPREIEELVVAHPDVDEAAVFGLPDERWGEVVAIAVTSTRGRQLEIEEIWAALGNRLAAYKRPRALFNVESLPKNPAGKVMKRQLRENMSSRWAGAKGPGERTQ